MKVHVHNQTQMQNLAPTAGTVAISITSPGKTVALQEGWEAVLRLKFVALDKKPQPDPPRGSFPGHKPKPLILFNEGIAREIDGFCHANHDKNFAVHCSAGLHRSLAIAAYIQDVFGAELVRHVPDHEDWDYKVNSMYLMLMEPYKGIFPCE